MQCCSFTRRPWPEQHMPRSCHQPKPLEAGCTDADPKLLEALSIAELPDQPQLSDM